MIAGGGFAMMAWRLAQERTYHQAAARGYARDIGPWPRDWLDMSHKGPSREYYRILDKAMAYFYRNQIPVDRTVYL